MKPTTIDELQSIVRSRPRLSPRGAGSKTALAMPEIVHRLDLSNLSGMLEYQPSEYTFTAYAGTRLSDVERELSEHGQFLPFDPPLGGRGATLGGTVATGLSGSGRYRFGGVRDFILAVQYLDGQGELVRAGGKVVKNSAGFDIPKMMVGSLGAFGALLELTFKVFPRPVAYTTLKAEYGTLHEALQALVLLATTPVDLFALDLIPHPSRVDLVLRIGGLPESFTARIQRLKGLLGKGEEIETPVENEYWREVGEFRWLPAQTALVKTPVTPKKVPELDKYLSENNATRRYSVGGNLAWIAWPGEIDLLDRGLAKLQLSGLVVLGSPGYSRLGVRTGEAFTRRIKLAMDPVGRWMEA